MTATDAVTGAATPISIDLVWTGTGEIFDRGFVHEFAHGPDAIVAQYLYEASKIADVAGTLTDGTTEFATRPANPPLISLVRTGFVLVERVLSSATVLWPRGPTSPTEATRATLRQVQTTFGSTDPTGCVVTFGLVTPTDSKVALTNGPATASSDLYVVIQQFDICASTLLYDFDGDFVLPDGAFKVAADLGSARLHTTVDGIENVSGNTVSLVVNIDWIATDPSSMSVSSGHSQTSLGVSTSVQRVVSQPAVGVGTVAEGTRKFR